MSPPIWLLDPSFIEKKPSKPNQIRNFSTGTNKKTDNVHTISDLITEMQDTLCENAKLQSENSLLRKDIAALQSKNEALLSDIEINKEKFGNDLNKLQNSIKMNEAHLIDNSKKCLQQQKKQIEEIVQLKSENEKLRLQIEKSECNEEKLKKMEDELKSVRLCYSTVKTQSEENAQKASKYKNKLKYAITIINDLNGMLIQYTKRPMLNSSETQTDHSHLQHEDSSSPPTTFTSPQLHTNLETENLLLGEIFFRSKSFCDNELFLFNESDSCHNLEN